MPGRESRRSRSQDRPGDIAIHAFPLSTRIKEVTTVSVMDHYPQIDHPAAWQESWDRQQQGYLPDREQRIAAMLDTVAAATDHEQVRLLDLAGGTGTISLRALRRFPDAQATL